MKGLIIKDPWITKILNGEKTWEIRGSRTKTRGRIALIKSGTGKIFGSAKLVDCEAVDAFAYDLMRDKHQIPDGQGLMPCYDNMWAWVLEDPLWYPHPIGYQHPQGAVIWVNL